VVDDEEAIRDLLADALTHWGYQVAGASNGVEATAELRQGKIFEIALLDIRMPEMDGLEFLREIKRHDPTTDVIIMTGYPTVGTAVEALKEGAYDYLTKPLILDEIRHLLTHVMERRFLRQEVVTLRSRLGEQLSLKEMVGVSPQMQRVKEVIAKVAMADSPVLIEGESGTGKELVAAAIHQLSPRAKKPFIPVNCGAIPNDLLESEFFGHVRGAFSGAVADSLGLFRSAEGGSMFLDEIAELPPPLQVKLLRTLQEKEVRPVGTSKAFAVDVRVIAATNRYLEEAVRDGSLRQDLFYRLNVVRVHLPPLRERKADIPALVTHFIREFNQRFRREIIGLTPQAMEALKAYSFPGNVRELENMLERAYALGAQGEITLQDLPLREPPATSPANEGSRPLPTLAEMERDLILQALKAFSGDKEKAAHALGLSRRTIYRRLKEYGLL
jgi:DNA-binding NtrC family response regulator